MADKSRERNYVDAFSDYGLDERQISIQNKIMTKCFKILYYGAALLSVIWLIVPTLTGLQIPIEYVAASYFLLAVICYNVYIIKASKHGAINGITATVWEGKASIILSLFVVVPILFRMFSEAGREFNEAHIILIILAVGVIANNIIAHVCGKRNFKVLDEDSSDDTEETEEE
ncbi:MAG: hypothetical protein K2G87_02790 [Oscillospiraceae bacterium]|nr:hypothetical protein [Oscillospiraceae bacterium]